MEIEKIEVKSLSKTYKVKNKSVKALEDVSFSAGSGSITSILGPNGAGKTTLLKILCGLILPDSGSVILNNTIEMKKNTDRLKKNLGFLPSSERSFYYRLTGWANLDFFAVLKNIDRAKRKKTIEAVLDLVSFPAEIIERPYMSYSKGEKQKLGLARAFLDKPSLLLLDEPTTGLDPIAQFELRKIIKTMREENKIVFLCTHNLQEAEELSDRVVILHKGLIMKNAGLFEIKQKDKRKAVSIVLKDFSLKDKVTECLATKFNVKVLDKNGILYFLTKENTDLRKVLGYLNDLMNEKHLISNFTVEDMSLEKIFSESFNAYKT